MTLLDLIRSLHKDGTVLLSYELFTTDDVVGIEDAIYGWDRNPQVSRLRYPGAVIDPGSVELGDKPEYLVCRSAEEYEDITYVSPPKGPYPVLLVCVGLESMEAFSKRWKGRHWSEIPPLELRLSRADRCPYALPKLTRDGVFCGYQETTPDDRRGSYYVLRSRYGDFFAWDGDLLKDPLPDGMTVEDAGKFI